MRRSLEWPVWVLLMLLPAGLSCGRGSDDRPAAPLRIAAAASLASVLPELIELHRERVPEAIEFSLGSSGLLARQIAEGAPFDLFMSANLEFADDLVAKGHGRAETRAVYARGRIALWAVRGSATPAPDLADLSDARFRRIALANPESAPFGLAAVQTLEHAGLWETLEPRIVYGDNILQALQMARSGNAEVALIALSLAISTEDGEWTLLHEEGHEPIDQALLVTARSQRPSAAEAFARTVASPAGRAILARHGYAAPGQALDPALIEAAGGRVAR